MNPSQATELHDLAAGLRSITAELTRHVDDPRPSEHLAGDLASLTWQHVENATFDADQAEREVAA